MTYSAAPMPENIDPTAGQRPPEASANYRAAFHEPQRPVFVLVLAILMATLCPILRIVEYIVSSAYTREAYQWTLSRTRPMQMYSSGEEMGRGIASQMAMNSSLTFHIISVITASLLYILCALLVGMGKNWGRIMLTVLASLGTLMSGVNMLGQLYTLVNPQAPAFANAQGYVTTLIFIYALLFLVNILLIVLVWLPPVNAYTRKVTAYWKAKEALAKLKSSRKYAEQSVAQQKTPDEGTPDAQQPPTGTP